MSCFERSQQRLDHWNEIAGLTAGLERICVSQGTPATLAIDPNIQPQLPHISTVIEKLKEQTAGHYSPDIRIALQAKCLHLQKHILEGYKNTVRRMISVQHETGINDVEVQRQHSKHLETWYAAAEKDILDACVARHTRTQSVRDPRRQLRVRFLMNHESSITQASPDELKSISNPGTILQQAFDINSSPNDKERAILAEVVGYTYKQVCDGSSQEG